MGAAESLRKAGYLLPLSQGLKTYVDQNRQRERMDKLAQLVLKSGIDIENLGKVGRTNQRTGQFEGIGDVPQDPNFYTQRTAQAQSDLIESLISLGADSNESNLALGNIESLINANAPLRPVQPDYMQLDPTKDLFDKTTLTVVRKGTPKPQVRDIEGRYENAETGTYFVFDKDKGEFIDTGVKFPKTKEKEAQPESLPDYGNLLGALNEGIKKVNTFVGTAKFNGDEVTYVDSKDFEVISDLDTYKREKEKIKSSYLKPAIQLLNEQGLDNTVMDIREDLKAGATLDEALQKFEELNRDNPEFKDRMKEDLRILRDYFTLFLL